MARFNHSTRTHPFLATLSTAIARKQAIIASLQRLQPVTLSRQRKKWTFSPLELSIPELLLLSDQRFEGLVESCAMSIEYVSPDEVVYNRQGY